jgi:NhaA family Na+:H+ antiporter
VSEANKRGFIDILQEFSIPLLGGVVVALVAANVWPEWYEHTLHWEPIAGLSIFGHSLTLHFIVNDIFMVFFFGIAAKEITESCLPGGSLNPPRKAVTPLIATLGGVVGPIGVFFVGLWLAFQLGIYDISSDDIGTLARGWGVPTATDIALAWLVARGVFGRGHPAVAFLLLLAVADDAIGLIIIAFFYGDPATPAAPEFLSLLLMGMAVAYLLRRMDVKFWVAYVALAGPLAWSGLMLAHMHPALALVVIVPFLPGPRRDFEMFVDQDEVDVMGEQLAGELGVQHSPLHLYEHHTKRFVDFGLFFFAFTNAGVAFTSIGAMTWLILISLLVGKTIGVTALALVALRLGFALPNGMGKRDLVMAGFIAALGLTVALFVATAAFVDPVLQGQAKMGALFSGGVGLVALFLGRLFGLARPEADATRVSDDGGSGGTPLSGAPEPVQASRD